jgi:membrane protease YdiL (CAAX protease family)
MIKDSPLVAPAAGSATASPPAPAAPDTAGAEPVAAIQRHQLLAFYILAFAISWVGIFLVIGGPANFPGTPEHIAQRFLLVMLAWLAGPSIASMVMTGVVSGRAGYRELFARLTRWRVCVRWYAVALLTAPLVYVGLCLALSTFVSPDFASAIFITADKASLLLMGLAYGILGGGLLEELGWTGFAVPRFRQRRRILTTGVLVGVLWGAYHFSVIYWATSPQPSGVLGMAILFLQLFAWLPAYRVLMVWVYDRTQSLLLAMLMHGSLTAGMLILQPQEPLAMVGTNLLTWLLAFTAVWWLIVAAVGLATRGYGER